MPRAEPLPALLQLRRLFAALWLCYDGIDLLGGYTVRTQLNGPASLAGWALCALQLLLLVAEVQVVRQRQVVAATAAAALLRLGQGLLFAANDFFFVAVIMAHLALLPAAAAGPSRWQRPAARRMTLQLAWIYAATAIFKLNPAWLGGGSLFVRQALLAEVHRWPYPAAYGGCMRALGCQATLAWAGLLGEAALAALLVLLALTARPLRRVRALAMGLCLSMHTFAALFTNVWFFGVSMVLLVGFATAWPHRAGVLPPSRALPDR